MFAFPIKSCNSIACLILAAIMLIPISQLAGQTESAKQNDMDVLFEADFEQGMNAWDALDDGWKIKTLGESKSDNAKQTAKGGEKVLSLHKKASNYKPPHRSPTHIALIKDKSFGSFQLDAQVLSTHQDYNHRDVCLFFGFVGPDQYYYVHLGKKMDPHANQIFIVKQADRTKISTKTTDGTPWDDQWHHVRIRRDIDTGRIEVYFDDMETPVMTATDKSFGKGQIGLGSFDDIADFRDIKIQAWKQKSE